MAHLGLVTLPRRTLAARPGWATPGSWDPTSIRVDPETDPLIPHAVQLPLDFLMVSTPADGRLTIRYRFLGEPVRDGRSGCRAHSKAAVGGTGQDHRLMLETESNYHS